MVSLCDIFLCTVTDIIRIKRTKICPKMFQIISKLPVVKSCASLSELAGTSFIKFPSFQSMEQFGVPCVKRVEGFCYFDCNIFFFGQIKVS